MAKKPTEKTDYNSLGDKEKSKLLAQALGTLHEFSDQCSSLADAQSNINSFEDTGCYILNALLSGELNGGFPEGRMSVLAAESSVGKSFIGIQTAAIAQRKGKHILVFDSENAIDKEFANNLGLDPAKTTYFPVRTIEQCRNSIYKFLKFVIENGMRGQFFILVDSLANMIAEIEMNRAEKDNSATDMGTRARAMKSFLQMCINMSGQSNTTIVCTNHIYDNPNAMFPSLIKPMPGGKCVTYLPSTILQLSAVNIKEGDDRKIKEEATVGGKGLLGKAVTGMSVKNRICKPFVTADMYISWKTGMSKYYGLTDLAQKFGLLENRAGRFYLTSNKEKMVGTRASLIDDAEFWESFMPTLQKSIDENWKYTSAADREVMEQQMKDEMEKMDDTPDDEDI